MTKMSLKKFYSALAILLLAGPAVGVEFKADSPKASIRLKAPELILNNKDIFQKLAHSPMGPRTSGGGNSCSLAITQNTRKLIELLRIEPFSKIVDIQKLLPIIQETRFYIQDPLKKDGQPKDAINFPGDNKIFLTSKFCAKELIEVSGRSMSLLLHEYLGLARIEDRKYEISGKFLDLYAENMSKNAPLRIYLEKELAKDLQGQKSCFDGAIKRKSAEISAINPDWFSERDIGLINTQVVNSAEYRNSLKNCDVFLDKNGQKTNDMQKAVDMVCKTFETFDYVVTVPFPHFSLRVNTQDGLVFKVEELRETSLTVDKGEVYADINSAKKASTSSSYKCAPLPF